MHLFPNSTDAQWDYIIYLFIYLFLPKVRLEVCGSV